MAAIMTSSAQNMPSRALSKPSNTFSAIALVIAPPAPFAA